MNLKKCLLWCCSALACVLFAQADNVTVTVTTNVLVHDVIPLGINFTDSYYDAPAMKKRVEKNFEGVVYRQCHPGTLFTNGFASIYASTNQFSQNGWNGLYPGASYTILSEPSYAVTGTVVSVSTRYVNTGSSYQWVPFFELDRTFPAAAGTNGINGVGLLVERYDQVDKGFLGLRGNYWISGNCGIATNDNAPGQFGTSSLQMDGSLSNCTYALPTFYDSLGDLAAGSWTVQFWVKSSSGSPQMKITSKYSGTQTLSVPSAWTLTQQVWSVASRASKAEQEVFTLNVSNGVVLVDNIEVWQNSDTNSTAYRDDFVNLMKSFNAGMLRRLIMGGGSLSNAIYPRAMQNAFQYTQQDQVGPYGESSNYKNGLHEFLQLCEEIGAQPWLNIPGTVNTAEMVHFMEYLAGPTNAGWGAIRAELGHPEPWTASGPVTIEFGNEAWNYDWAYLLGGFNGTNYWSGLINAAKESAYYNSNILFQAAGQNFDAAMAARIINDATNADLYAIAPYALTSLSTDDTSVQDTDQKLFQWMMAYPLWETYSRLSAHLPLMTNGMEYSIYEFNYSTLGGDAPVDVRNKFLASQAAAVGVANQSLLYLKEYGIRRQCLFTLNQEYYNNIDLWGVVLSYKHGEERYRPHWLANLAVNQVRAGDLVETALSSNLTQTTYGRFSTLTTTAPTNRSYASLFTYGFRDGRTNGLVLINYDLTQTQNVSVVFDGLVLATQAVSWVLDSSSYTNNNEWTNSSAQISLVQTTLTDFVSGSTVSVAPGSLRVLRWERDPEAPAVADYDPAPGSTNAYPGLLQMTFNEPVTAGSGHIRVYSALNGTVVRDFAANGTNVSVNSRTVTLTPGPELNYSTAYYITADADAFYDLETNAWAGIAATDTWHFVTGLSSSTNSLRIDCGLTNSLVETDGSWQGLGLAYSPVPVAKSTNTIGQLGTSIVTVALSSVNALSGRDRSNPSADSGDLTYSSVYRDLIQSSTGGSITMGIGGLKPSAPYTVRTWIYDYGNASGASFTNRDVTDGRDVVLGVITNTYSVAPTNNTMYTVFASITSSVSGGISLLVNAGSSSQAARINGLEIQEIVAGSAFTKNLTILSPYGMTQPAAGIYTHVRGDSVTVQITNNLITAGSTQAVVAGWIGTGSAPASGTGTSVTFAIAANSSILWSWETNYLVSATAATNGTVNGGGWIRSGSNAVLTATPNNGYKFTGWSGDVSSGDVLSNPLTISVTTPRTLLASFSPLGTNTLFVDFGSTNSLVETNGSWQGFGLNGTSESKPSVRTFSFGSTNLTVSLNCPYTLSGRDRSNPTVNTGALTYAAMYRDLATVNSGNITMTVAGLSADENVLIQTWMYDYQYANTNTFTLTDITDGRNTLIGSVLNKTGAANKPTNNAMYSVTGSVNVGTSGTLVFVFSGNASARFNGFRLQENEGGGTPPTASNTLTVISAYSSPNPSVGQHVYANGTVVTAGIPDSVFTTGSTQLVMTGWAGTGSVPASGTGTGLTFTITGDSSLTWSWATNYYITASAAHGTVSGAGWARSGSNAVLTATGSSGYLFAGWSGDVPVGQTNDNPLSLAVAQPLAVTANFVESGVAPATNILRVDFGLTTSATETNGSWQAFGLNSTSESKPSVRTFTMGSATNVTVTLTTANTLYGRERANPTNNTGSLGYASMYRDMASVNSGNITVTIGGLTANGPMMLRAWMYDYLYADGNIFTLTDTTDGRSNLLGSVTNDTGAAAIPTNNTMYSVGFPVTAGTNGTLVLLFSGNTAARFNGIELVEVIGGTSNASNALVVVSEHGTPVPAAGNYTYGYGNVVSAYMTGSVLTSGSTQLVLTGWTGTGSVPASGTETGVAFAVTEDSSLIWNWATNYYVTATAAAHGSVSGSGWVRSGSNAVITASANNGYQFAGWSGNVPAGQTNDNPLSLSVVNPASLTANFAPGAVRLTADNVRIVDFGSKLGTGYYRGQTAPKSYTPRVDQDGNGTLSNDTVRSWIYSYDVPLNAPALEYDVNAPSTVFYGGLTLYAVNNPDRTITEGLVNQNHEFFDDLNFMGLGASTSNELFKGFATWFWKKENFLNGGDQAAVSFNSNSLITVYISRYWGGVNAGRWMVQDGDQFYLSQSTFAGLTNQYDITTTNLPAPYTGDGANNPIVRNNHSLCPDTSLWAVYTPAPDANTNYAYEIDFDASAAQFAPHTFSNVTAVGFFVERQLSPPVRVAMGLLDIQPMAVKWNAFRCEAVVQRAETNSYYAPLAPVTTNAIGADVYVASNRIPYQLWRKVFRHSQRRQYPRGFGVDGEMTYSFEHDGSMGSMRADDLPHDGLEPVTDVSWLDAVAFCNGLSELEGLKPVYYTDETMTNVLRVIKDRDSVENWTNVPAVYWDTQALGFRLPTAAEWDSMDSSLKSTGVWEWVWDVNGTAASASLNQHTLKGYLMTAPTSSVSRFTERPWQGSSRISFRVAITGTETPNIGTAGSGWIVSSTTQLAPEQPWTQTELQGAVTQQCTMVTLDVGLADSSHSADTNFVPSAAISSNPYSLDVALTEVPYSLWNRVRSWGEENGYGFNYSGDMGSMGNAPDATEFAQSEPVTEISLYDAYVWCNALSELMGRTPVYYLDAGFSSAYRQANLFRLETLKREGSPNWPGGYLLPYDTASLIPVYMNTQADGYRLLLPQEWALADVIDSNTTLSAYNWLGSNSDGKTHPVGTKLPNTLGLYDMEGNVLELTWGSTKATINDAPFRMGSHFARDALIGKSPSLWAEFSGVGRTHVGFRVAALPVSAKANKTVSLLSASDSELAVNGVPKSWLKANGLPQTDDAALADADGDGQPAWAEYVAGTSPTKAKSVFAVSGRGEASGRVLEWSSVSGRVYGVYWSTNLTQGFKAFSDATNLLWPVNCYTDTVHEADGQMFYKIDVQLSP